MLRGSTGIKTPDPVTKCDTTAKMKKYNVRQMTNTALQEVTNDKFIVKTPDSLILHGCPEFYAVSGVTDLYSAKNFSRTSSTGISCPV